MLRISLITNQLMASSNESSDDLVLYDYQQKVCKATLNKPKALNSLDLQMVRNLQQEVNKWKENSDLKVTFSLFLQYI